MTCSLKLNISKCDQFLKWQKPITLFKNTYKHVGCRPEATFILAGRVAVTG